MVEKVNKLKILHDLVRKLNKLDDNTQDCTYGVYCDFVRELAHYFFITINEQPYSICNMFKYSQLKKGNVTKTVWTNVYEFV